jgi:hypothetical protein
VESRRCVIPWSGTRCLAFEAGYPLGELIEVSTQGLDRRIAPLPWLFLLRAAGAVGNEDASALVGDDDSLVAQDGHGVVDGHGRDAVLAGELAPGGELLAGRERAAHYLAPEVVGDLQVGRPGIVCVRRHLFRLRRPRSLGRTTSGTVLLR